MAVTLKFSNNELVDISGIKSLQFKKAREMRVSATAADDSV